MKERPILFSAPMVRALLNCTKSQTRRVAKPQPNILAGELFSWKDKAMTAGELLQCCPYGQPGDRLWVREAWGAPYCDRPGVQNGKRPALGDDIRYRADPDQEWQWRDGSMPWRPSIHMPRWASRIVLEIVSVRIERLQDISEADAIAEGIERNADYPKLWKRGNLHGDQNTMKSTAFPKLAYRSIWEQINGHESWTANPWVWAVEFKRIQP